MKLIRQFLAKESVLLSTPKSVEQDRPSLLAIGEAFFAIWLYWQIASWLDSQVLLWANLIVAPLLLLRSDASVATGIAWTTKYIDRSFSEVLGLPRHPFYSVKFWCSVLVAAICGGVASFGLSLVIPTTWTIVAFGVGYAATQFALASATAFAAKEVAAVAERKGPAFSVAFFLLIAVGAGSFLARRPALYVAASMAATGITALPALLSAQNVIIAASARTSVRGMTIVRAIASEAPASFAAFVPGFFLGAWIRSVLTRFGATMINLGHGARAFPDNWWRTVICTDVATLPEIVPGYEGQDPFNVRYLSPSRHRYGTFGRYACYVAMLFLVVPAYFYRLAIKSSCWAYAPVMYIGTPPDLAHDPALVAKLMWKSPKEWGRRVLVAFSILGLVVVALPKSVVDIKSLLPPVVISPLEYFFVLDFSQLRPWMWLNLVSASMTLFLAVYTLDLFIYAGSMDRNLGAKTKALRISWAVELVMRARDFSTTCLLVVIFFHGVFTVFPNFRCWWSGLSYLLRIIYGDAVPVPTLCSI